MIVDACAPCNGTHEVQHNLVSAFLNHWLMERRILFCFNFFFHLEIYWHRNREERANGMFCVYGNTATTLENNKTMGMGKWSLRCVNVKNATLIYVRFSCWLWLCLLILYWKKTPRERLKTRKRKRKTKNNEDIVCQVFLPFTTNSSVACNPERKHQNSE